MVTGGVPSRPFFITIASRRYGTLSLEEIMKRTEIIRYFGSLCLLVVFAMLLSGCMGTPGETRAEANRRRGHIMRTNMSLISDDIDAILMLDKPSKTSEKLIRP